MYDMIFKRRSFHLFRNLGPETLSETELQDIQQAFSEMTPLYPGIRTAIRIVPANAKAMGRGAEYAIEIYSEKKENYRMNAGYLGEQLDLYLVSKNIASLWFGIGKPEEAERDGLHFVIMILIAKTDCETRFRKDMFKSKRKSIEEIWQGEAIPGVSDIVRFAPSACNSQPWRVERNGEELTVFRYRKPGRVGIMPGFMVAYYNGIDIGIFLYFLELCLEHEGYSFSRELFADTDDKATEVRVAGYHLIKA